MMKRRPNPVLSKLGVFTLAQAKDEGVTQQDISRLVAANELVRIERGIFLHPKAHLDRDVGFQIAISKFGPESAVGGLSALYYYNLADQVPGEIWLVVPPEKRTRVKGYRLMRTKTSLDKEIHDEKGYRIVTIERAILEALKFITKIGEKTAIKAAREALASGQTTEIKLAKAARNLGLESVLSKYLEVITP